MKKLIKSILCVLAIFFFTATYAGSVKYNLEGSVKKKTIFSDETPQITLNFISSEYFQEYDRNQLDIEQECLVSISVTVTVGSTSVTMRATNIPCREYQARIKELEEAALASLG